LKKPLKIILIVFTSIFIMAGTALGFLFADQIKAVRSITELTPGLYYLEYRGDYGFPAFLERDGAKA
jgi:flagellar basal body-associated protein FliL